MKITVIYFVGNICEQNILLTDPERDRHTDSGILSFQIIDLTARMRLNDDTSISGFCFNKASNFPLRSLFSSLSKTQDVTNVLFGYKEQIKVNVVLTEQYREGQNDYNVLASH